MEDNINTVKVKCTPVQALRLCTGRMNHRGSRGIALSFLDHGTRRGWGVSVTPRPHFTPGKDPLHTVQKAGWAPGPVWTGAENLAPNRDSIPGPSSPYPVAVPTHNINMDKVKIICEPGIGQGLGRGALSLHVLLPEVWPSTERYECLSTTQWK